MELSLAIGVTALALPGPDGSVVVPPPASALSAINAEGWDATYPSPPTAFDPVGAPVTVSVSRAGFNGTGAAVTRADTLTVTKRVRLPYPNQGTLHADRVALSDVVYAADTIAGVTNGSTAVSPKPVCLWAVPDRRVVGNLLPAAHLEIVAFHRDARDGEQVACVEWIVSDGTTSVTAKVSASTVSGRAGDRGAVIVYRPAADIDISGLADEVTLSVRAKVYPHHGIAASVRDSADLTNPWEFTNRAFRRSVARSAAPYYIYVDAATGSATAVVSTDPALAAAAPATSVSGAIDRLNTVNGTVDYAVIRLVAGSHLFSILGSSTSRPQSHSGLVIEPAPGAETTAVMTIGANNAQPTLNSAFGEQCVTFRNLRIQRTGTGGFARPGSGFGSTQIVRLWFDNCTIEMGSYTGALFATAGAVKGLATGCTITAAANHGTLGTDASNGPKWRLMRGMQASVDSLEQWAILGSSITGVSALARSATQTTRSVTAFSRFSNIGYAGDFYNYGATGSLFEDAAFVQNLVEYLRTEGNATFRVSSDDAPSANSHVLILHNTFTGFYSAGRANLFYDEGTTARASRLMACAGNIHCQINNKGDLFANNGSRTDNWQYYYGAGCQGEFAMFMSADPGDGFKQAYPGLRAKIGSSASLRNDPLFVDYRGTMSGTVAGAGGGDYRLGAGSPARGMVRPVLKWDLAGAARSAVMASSGAYE